MAVRSFWVINIDLGLYEKGALGAPFFVMRLR